MSYPEVLWTTVHAIFYINNPKVSKCEPVMNLIKKLIAYYPELPKNLKMDELCGMRDYGIFVTAYKALVCQQFYYKWRYYFNKKRYGSF